MGGMFKSPMTIIMILSMVMMFFLPKMMANLDPEQLEVRSVRKSLRLELPSQKFFGVEERCLLNGLQIILHLVLVIRVGRSICLVAAWPQNCLPVLCEVGKLRLHRVIFPGCDVLEREPGSLAQETYFLFPAPATFFVAHYLFFQSRESVPARFVHGVRCGRSALLTSASRLVQGLPGMGRC